MFTPADKRFPNPNFKPNFKPIYKELTNKQSPFYQSTHKLLSYKWKNPQGFVQTCYLDTVFEKSYPSNHSEPSAGLWWYSFVDILNSYKRQILHKFNHNTPLTPAESSFVASVSLFFDHFKFSSDRLSRINDVKIACYHIFKLFNDCLQKKEDGNDLVRYEPPPRSMDQVMIDNARFYVQTHQDDLKLHLAWQAVSSTKRRGRPPKVRYYRPDLYGFD